MDKFRIVSKIGRGSYGQVWLVRHKKDKKHYVLKEINLENASEREIRAAHLEVQLLSSLRHPNIVCYRDAFKSGDNLLFIAMSYCEGGDLYRKIKEQKGVYFQEIQVLEWFIQTCMALQYLHERNILHRDLKTQNIFLTRSKVIKVGDLGIAKVLDSDSSMATTMIGTPYYMSPELFSNKPYNHKSDVWALGCCIYEIATLRHAFNANDINALMYKILRGKLPCMPRQYSPELTNLIRAMLNQNPEQRPAVSRILRDPFVKKNIAVFLEGTKVSTRHDGRGLPEQKKTQSVQTTDGGKIQQMFEENIIRHVAGDEPIVPCRPFPEKNRASIDLYLKGQSVFQVNIAANSQQIQRKPVSDCRDYKELCSVRVSSSRSTSSQESDNTDALHTDNIISSDLVITGSEIKLEERIMENLNEQKKSPKRQKGLLVDNVVNIQGSKESQKVLPSNGNNAQPVHMKGCCLQLSGCSSSEKQNSGANMQEPVQRTKLNKISPERRRLKQVNKQDTDSPAIVHASYETSCRNKTEVRTKPLPESSVSNIDGGQLKQQNCNKQEGHGSERTHQNLSARQRRRAKMKQELHSSSENEEINGVRCLETEAETDRNLHASPLGVRKNEAIENENPAVPRPKIDEDLTALLTLLDITLHDERSPTDDLKEGKQNYLVLEDADTRLKNRIKLLHRDCVEGLGLGVLSQALQMLNNYSSLELEAKLQNLLGMTKFVQFIGKIWQLKFCQDSVESCQADKI